MVDGLGWIDGAFEKERGRVVGILGGGEVAYAGGVEEIAEGKFSVIDDADRSCDEEREDEEWYECEDGAEGECGAHGCDVVGVETVSAEFGEFVVVAEEAGFVSIGWVCHGLTCV